MAENENFTIYRGDDTDVFFDDGPVGSVAGWTTALYLSLTPSSDPVLTVSGVTTDDGSSTTTGKFRCRITASNSLTLGARNYYYAFKRLSPAEKVLASGKLQVKPDIKNKVA